MTEDTGWKQVGDVYKTSGTILEPGTFISKSGTEVVITPDDAIDFHTSLNNRIPMTIDHTSEPFGYAIKFSKDQNNFINHEGIVVDSDVFNEKVILGGYNSISPEIDYIYDSRGNVISKQLVGISFVKTPAMNNTKANITRFAFSAPSVEVNIMADEPAPTQNTSQSTQQPAFDMSALADMITAGVSAKFESQIEALQSEIAALKSSNTPPVSNPAQEYLTNKGVIPEPETPKTDVNPENFAHTVGTIAPLVDKEVFEEYAKTRAELEAREAELAKYREQSEKTLRKQYSDVVAELKNIGYATPETMVKSLKTYEEKIETLNAIKTNHVKNTPMTSSAKTPMNTEGGSGSNANKPTILGLAESLRLVVPQELREPLSKRLGIPIQ